MLVERVPGAAEAVGFDHVGAGGKERGVRAQHDVRLLRIEPFHAAADRRAQFLQLRAHAAVEDDDPLARAGEESFGRGVLHWSSDFRTSDTTRPLPMV
jgi:hypothetical protein